MINNTHVLKGRTTSSYKKGATPQETVIIGAGLSKAFGLPLATEILPCMIEWHTSHGRHQAIRPILDFLAFFYPGFEPAKEWYPPAEDVMGMFDAAEEYSRLRGEHSRGFRWRGGRIAQLRICFNKLLAQYLWSFQTDIQASGYAVLDPLRRYVHSKGPRVTYVTFNYDLLLETALSLEGIQYSYRLDNTSKITTLLKPHGSINWFLRTSGKVFNMPIWAEFGPNISIFSGLDPTLLPFRGDVWKQVMLIAPTPHKEFSLIEMKKTWTSFSSSVHAAPVLTVIGYSLPDADRVARLVLNRAGPKHSLNRQITVVNPADVKAAFSQYVSPNCRFIRKRFEDFA